MVLQRLERVVLIRRINVTVTPRIKVHVCIVDNLLMDHVHTHLRKSTCMVIVNQENLDDADIAAHHPMVVVPVPLQGTMSIKRKLNKVVFWTQKNFLIS